MTHTARLRSFEISDTVFKQLLAHSQFLGKCFERALVVDVKGLALELRVDNGARNEQRGGELVRGNLDAVRPHRRLLIAMEYAKGLVDMNACCELVAMER